MAQISFNHIQDDEDVAVHLQCSTEFLESFSRAGAASFYREMRIPKKARSRRGQYRIVYKASNRLLAVVQKQLASALALTYEAAGGVHGFVRNRSTLTNARVHLGARLLLHADISDFFGSISVERVRGLFEGLGCGRGAASTLAELTTLNGTLVPGASSSPCIANMVCRGLDSGLEELAADVGCSWTRYCDDIAFSGESVPTRSQVETLLGLHGFSLAKEKFRWQRRGRSQFVTGLSVADFDQPRAPRRMKRWLRSVVNLASKYGVDQLVDDTVPYFVLWSEVARIDGTIAYLYGVEPGLAARLDGRWQAALKSGGFDCTRPSRRVGS